MEAKTTEILARAKKGEQAVGAFNIFDNLTLRAVARAADRLGVPAVIQVSVRTARAIGPRLIRDMFAAAAAEVRVPLSLHLDHCPDLAVIDAVIDAGWSSVLFDASDRDLDEAKALTADVVHRAHDHGVEVESEIENIVGVEDGVGSNVIAHAYSEELLVEIAEETHVDLLAPQLGTAHGRYQSKPKLLPRRVERLVQLTDRPIVLHGGTGLSGDQFRSFIRAGVTKINVSTAVKTTYLSSMRDVLADRLPRDLWEPLPVFDLVGRAVEDEIAAHMAVFACRSEEE